MEKPIDNDIIARAARALIVNTLVNDYAVERVAFGFEKPGDKAPIDLYLKHLGLDLNDGLHRRSDVYGVYIDEDERINDEQDYSEYVRDLFASHMERIFIDAPKDIRLERASEELPLTSRFRDYLFGLLPLFTEVLNTKVEYTPFDVIPLDKATLIEQYPMWRKFVTAILLKPLRAGGRINRYVKDFTDETPYFIKRLVEKKGNNYYLKTADEKSNDYIFALFSLMRFIKSENDKLLELRLHELERQQHRC